MLPKWIENWSEKLMDFLNRSWMGSWAPTGTDGCVKSARPGSTGRGRGGVKTLPQREDGVGGRRILWEGVLLIYLSPGGLVGCELLSLNNLASH